MDLVPSVPSEALVGEWSPEKEGALTRAEENLEEQHGWQSTGFQKGLW